MFPGIFFEKNIEKSGTAYAKFSENLLPSNKIYEKFQWKLEEILENMPTTKKIFKN